MNHNRFLDLADSIRALDRQQLQMLIGDAWSLSKTELLAGRPEAVQPWLDLSAALATFADRRLAFDDEWDDDEVGVGELIPD